MDLKLPQTHKQVFQTALFYIFVKRRLVAAFLCLVYITDIFQ